jgi:pimeloyl-ACP methyl ester carboxylesterase
MKIKHKHKSEHFTLPEIVTPKVKRRIGKTILIMFILFLVIASVLFVLGVKVRFILGEELSVNIKQDTSSYLVNSDQAVDLSFSVANDNFFKCNSQCNYELIDLDNNKLVFSEEFYLEHNQEYQNNVIVNSKGFGNRLYLYSLNIQCHNIKSLVCLTDEAIKHNSALFYVETELTAEEKSLSLDILEKLETENEKLNSLKSKYSEHQTLLANNFPLSTEMKKEKLKLKTINNSFTEIEKHLNQQINFWQKSDFNKFSPTPKLEDSLLSLTTTGKRIRELLSIRNNTIGVLNQVAAKNGEIKEAYYHSPLITEEVNKLQQVNDLLISGGNLSDEAINLQVKNSETVIVKLLDDFSLQANLLINHYSPITNTFVSKNDCNALNLIKKQIVEENLTVSTVNLDSFIDKNCLIDKSNLSLLNITVATPNLAFEGSLPDFKLNFGEQTKQCCLFNECKPYDSQDSETLTLFIHGHALNKANTPEASMAAFAKLQEELQSNGFVNAAEISFGEVNDHLNNCAFPLTARSTFYYIPHLGFGRYSLTAQKSERIENYALRLREILEEVKKNVPNHKVNIVAHSMGGLVVREYLDLFGVKDLEKVVFINSPHHGVTGKVQKFCSLIGASKECEDLSAGSVFLQRINSKQLPKGIDYYNIRSKGCLMETEDGDGVVTLESAYLSGAEDIIISGQCLDSLQSGLHSDVLNPELYPEIVNILKDILAE